MVRKFINRFRLLLFIATILATGVFAQDNVPTHTNVAIIMDASGSMQALTGDGRSRIAVAKEAIIALSSDLPETTNASLWVYGHRLGQEDPAASCQDIEEVIPLSPVDEANFATTVNSLNAIGYTPISTSLQMAAASLPPGESNVIVLMSDGEESCAGDPCAVAQALAAGGVDLIINTIGFAPDANTRAQLQCVASVANGTYYEAEDAGRLQASLREASIQVAPPTATPEPTAAPTAVPQLDEQEGELPFNLSKTMSDANRSTYPLAMLDAAENLHVVWRDTSTRAVGEDWLHRVRSPQGRWSPTRNVTEPFENWVPGSSTVVSGYDGSICAFVEGWLYGQGGLQAHQTCFVDGVWSAPALSTVFTTTNDGVAVSIDVAGRVHGVANRGNTIAFVETDEQLSDDELATNQMFVIDAAGGYHITWLRLGNQFTVEHRYSPDNGTTWTPMETLSSTADDSTPGEPQLTFDRLGGVHLLYTNGSQVEYRKWTPETLWSEITIIPDLVGVLPRIAVDQSGLAYVVTSSSSVIRYTHQRPDGSWTAPIEVVQQDDLGTDTAIVVDSANTLHLVWHDPTQEDIFYTQLPPVE